jgi:2-polyprenyl-6-methoxyphenol hydroxylase-like FAD-dependent oxidoreductase
MSKANERSKQMGKQSSDFKQLSREELSELAGEELPERAAMSLVNANIAIPINAAVAANVLSDGAIAYADAAQTTPIDQSN